MTLYDTEPRNTMEAIQDHSIKGMDLAGSRRPVAVDMGGQLIIAGTLVRPTGKLYTLSVSSTAVKIPSVNLPVAANYAEGYVRTATVVFTTDGNTTPTSTVGTPADMGDTIILRSRDEVVNFKTIREGGTDASINFEFYFTVEGNNA